VCRSAKKFGAGRSSHLRVTASFPLPQMTRFLCLFPLGFGAQQVLDDSHATVRFIPAHDPDKNLFLSGFQNKSSINNPGDAVVISRPR
jgi:hypothetical protein